MPNPTDLRKQFIKVFEGFAHHRDRHDVFADFLEMAECAIRKRTLPPGPEADAIEARYMSVVRRNRTEDVRAMPELLGIATIALQDGGSDFLGQVAAELDLVRGHMGQFFTPYDVSRMIAAMTFDTVAEVIAEQGFVTVQEPASGAGGMVIAAADTLAAQGFDVGQHLYVDATDISPLCFRMTYLQASLRGIPATIRRGNSITLEMFDQAVTPAFFPFYAAHREQFDAWRQGAIEGAGGHDAELSGQDAEITPAPPQETPAERPPGPLPARNPTRPQQLDLFG